MDGTFHTFYTRFSPSLPCMHEAKVETVAVLAKKLQGAWAHKQCMGQSSLVESIGPSLWTLPDTGISQSGLSLGAWGTSGDRGPPVGPGAKPAPVRAWGLSPQKRENV